MKTLKTNLKFSVDKKALASPKAKFISSSKNINGAVDGKIKVTTDFISSKKLKLISK